MSITILGYPTAPSRLHSAVAASALSRSLAGDLARTLAFSLPAIIVAGILLLAYGMWQKGKMKRLGNN